MASWLIISLVMPLMTLCLMKANRLGQTRDQTPASGRRLGPPVRHPNSKASPAHRRQQLRLRLTDASVRFRARSTLR